MDPKLYCALIVAAVLVSCYAAEIPRVRERRDFRYADFHSIVKRQPILEDGMPPEDGLAALGPEITALVQQCVDEILGSVSLEGQK